MQTVFKRYEIKYLITIEQYKELLKIFEEYMKSDKHGNNLINNIYFDTKDYKLIRKSLERPLYKEKLRVRSYGSNTDDVFIEIKKKYDGVVYKRRICANKKEVVSYLVEDKPLKEENQITKEIDYFKTFYNNLEPSVFLSYEREAFYGKDNNDFRVTFDKNIKMRDYNMFGLGNNEGKSILPQGRVLLEVKTGYGIPSWLLKYFSDNKIYKTSFSKYGIAYQKYLFKKEEERKIC